MTKVVGVRVPPPAPSADSVCMRIAGGPVSGAPGEIGSAEPPTQASRRASTRLTDVRAVRPDESEKKIDAMQVTETLAEGLKHEFQISVPASDLDAKADARLVDLKDKVRLNGFRPGKVPVSHLKKVYGRSVMAETIDQTIRDTNSQIFTERGFRLATEPKITMPTEEKAVEDILAGKSDLTYTVSIEVVPSIALADFKSFTVEKPVADVTDADVDDAIKRIADQNKAYVAKGEGAKAETGDRVTVSFKGTIDGTPFDGGTGEGIQVVIGTGQFIPGFEEQLVGIASGESNTFFFFFFFFVRVWLSSCARALGFAGFRSARLSKAGDSALNWNLNPQIRGFYDDKPQLSHSVEFSDQLRKAGATETPITLGDAPSLGMLFRLENKSPDGEKVKATPQTAGAAVSLPDVHTPAQEIAVSESVRGEAGAVSCSCDRGSRKRTASIRKTTLPEPKNSSIETWH